MKKFVLTIVLSSDGVGISGRIPNGMYRNLLIEADRHSTAIPAEVADLISMNHDTIRSATLKDFDILSTFTLLTAIPNVTKLVLINCRLQPNELTVGSVEFSCLKHIEVSGHIAVLNCIARHRVEVLKVYNDAVVLHTTENQSMKTVINSFLETCTHLRALTLSNIKAVIEFRSDSICFQLETLVIEKINASDENLLAFLGSQKASLKFLAIEEKQPRTEILSFVIYEMNLNQLEIDVKMVPRFFPTSIRNVSIKKLTLRGVAVRGSIHEEPNECKEINIIKKTLPYDKSLAISM
jgi:hypothetical protein